MTHIPGILIANLGTPDAPSAPALRRYLGQFLGDPRIIEMPRLLWWPLLHGIILQTRPPRSARLYQAIWTEDGSPLRSTSQRIVEKLRQRIALPIEPGMRYGSPSIPAALAALRDQGVDRVLVLPLFAQYSATTTASIFDAVFDELRTWRDVPALRTVRSYHDHPLYLDALAASVQDAWADRPRPARLLMSFHGIPQSYADRGDPYPRYCEATARLLADRLDLPADGWRISYQSQFGPGQWLSPTTAEMLKTWAAEGSVPSVDVICPGFSVDSLETLEEINVENRGYFEAGGGTFHYIPALNDSEAHLALLSALVNDNLAGWVQVTGSSST